MNSFYGRRTSRRLRTVAQALDEFQGEDVHADTVVILPPAAGDSSVDSDVEPLNENDLQDDQVFETAGEVEVEYEEAVETNESEDGQQQEEQSSEYSEDRSSRQLRKRQNKVTNPIQKQKVARSSSCASTSNRKQPVKSQRIASTWKKTVKFDRILTVSSTRSLADTYPVLQHLPPMAYFDFLFDEEMFKLLAEQTLLYARVDKNDPNFTVTCADLRQFCGILLLSGYHTLPEEAHYWSNQPDLGVTVVSAAMSSKRFQAIKRYFHVADNRQLEQGNKVAKIKPLYDALNKNLTQFGVFHDQLSIDESMVPYFGRHSCKMFIRGKPIRFGYKVWVLAGKDGFPYHLKIYTGREDVGTTSPLGTRVVQHMIASIESHTTIHKHHFFFDNFFTSYQLLKELADNDVRATGTVQEFRTSTHETLFILNMLMVSGEKDDRYFLMIYSAKLKSHRCYKVSKVV